MKDTKKESRVVYQVIDWKLYYENAKSRTINNPNWIAMPNKQDGLSYRRMVLKHPEFYAVFVGILLACSKQNPIDGKGKRHDRDGWLTADGLPDGEPWDAVDISLKTGISESLISEALPYLCGSKIGWLRTSKQFTSSL